MSVMTAEEEREYVQEFAEGVFCRIWIDNLRPAFRSSNARLPWHNTSSIKYVSEIYPQKCKMQNQMPNANTHNDVGSAVMTASLAFGKAS